MSSQNASISPLLQRIQVGKYDITEYVLNCQVMKALAEPAGFFAITLRPEIVNAAIVDFSNIQINDFVEIRVGRVLVDTPGGKDAPIVMRGLVDAIEISEDYAQDMDGTPQRTVSISGRDLTKLIIDKSLWVPQEQWSDYSLERTNMILGLDAQLDEKNSETNLDQSVFQEIKPWIEGIMQKVFNDPLVGMDFGNNVRFSIDVNLPKNNNAAERVKAQAGFTLNGFKGTLFNYIETYIARPFMEMFIEDYEQETKLKIRWAPFRDRWGDFPRQATEHLGGKTDDKKWAYDGNARFWWDTKRDPYMSVINSNEILSKNIRRHSGDVYTYFFTTWGGFTPMDPRAADRGIWDSAEKEVAEETDTFVAGPRKYLNTNPRFNPQYDFLGMKRFGLKPLVVAIPFWTQDAGEAEVSEERVVGEVGPAGTTDATGAPITSSSITTTISSLYAYTIMKEKAQISEVPLYQPHSAAENKALIENVKISTKTPVIDEKKWPRTPKVPLPGIGKTYTRRSSIKDVDETMDFDNPNPHASLSHDTAYSTTFPFPAGITGKLYVLATMYAGSKLFRDFYFDLIDKHGNSVDGTKIPVYWVGLTNSGGSIDMHPEAVAGRFSVMVDTYTEAGANNHDSFIGDFYVTTETKTSTTTSASGTTTATTGSSGAVGRDAAVAWAIKQLATNKQGYIKGKITYCEMFTRLAFNGNRFYDTAWDNAKANKTGDHIEQAVVGDLVFFKQDEKTNGNAGHVAIISKIEVKNGKKDYFMIGAVNSGLEQTSISQSDYWRGLFYGVGTGEKSYGDGTRTKTVSTTVTSPASGLSVPAGGGTKTVIVDRVMKEAVSDEISTLLDDCNQWMYDTLRQMDKCYAGKIRIIGNPFIKVGMELVIDDDETNNYSAQKSFKNRNSVNYSQNMEKSTDTLSDKKDTRERYYVESVHHSWSVFPRPNFVTELGLTRGIFVSGKDVPFEIGDKGGFAAANTAYGAQAVKKLSQAEKDAINPPLVPPIAKP